MPKPAKRLPPDAGAWEPAHLQMIAFPAVSPVGLDQNWFRDLTGEEPKESTRKVHERVDQGSQGSVLLNLTADLLRVILTVFPQPPADPEKPPERIPSLGPLNPAVVSFGKLATKWLAGQHPPIKRLAFSGRLIQPTKNHRTGYLTLGKYLRAVKVDPKSGDFMYRINRRRACKSWVRSLEINRLSTWSVLKAGMRIEGKLPSGETTGPKPIGSDLFACVIEFDVNTMPEFTGEIPANKVVPIFRELVSLAVEIAAKGDVP
jgi:hypothetical protein